MSYADGQVRWQRVRQGDYGSHWRAGGQIVFEAPDRPAPLSAGTMRFDRLASHELVRARILPKSDAGMQAAGMAAAVGAALTPLLVSTIYSLSLAVAVRRQYLVWQAGWAATMLLWGGLWSQLHLALLPFMAGTVSAQICTFLACLAVAFATTSSVTAPDRRDRKRVVEGKRVSVRGDLGGRCKHKKKNIRKQKQCRLREHNNINVIF